MISVGWATVLNEKLDVCQQLKQNLGLDCPTSDFSFRHAVDLPGSMPRGTYTFKAEGKQDPGNGGGELSCLGAEMRF